MNTILYELNNAVATITLNRPDKLNAVTDEMVAELTEAFAQARANERVRAVILTGAGRAFAAGADMRELADNHTAEGITELIIGRYKPLFLAITQLPKPVIAAIHGPAAGMAAALALACDLRVMSEDAYLVLSFTNIGLMAAAGSTWLLTHLLGYSRAYELAAEGEKIGAAQCLAWGLCNQIVPNDALAEQAFNRAVKLAQRPTLALGLTKLAMHQTYTHTFEQQFDLEGHWQQQTVAGHDHKEGVRAFFEKRPAQFIGH